MFQSTSEYISLERALAGIDAGEIALPAFQREFDWSAADVRALLATVLMGWPAGSILFLDGESSFLDKARPFDSGPEPVDRPGAFVLDGQQRLTGLYHAIFDRGPYVYAIRVRDLFGRDVEAVEEATVSISRSVWDDRFRGEPLDSEDPLVPCYALRSAEAFYSWRDAVTTQERFLLEDARLRLADLHNSFLRHLHDYEFPLITLRAPAPDEDLARIFERVNRTGLQLGAFDLAVARAYDPKWDLRDRWDEARLDYPLLDHFIGEDGLPVLQVISMREERNIRRSAVLSLPPAVIHRDWEAAVAATNQAVEFVARQCGAVRADWLPYRGMLIPLAAVAWDHDMAQASTLLRGWFFSRAFGLRFDAAANTRLVEDYDELLSALRSDDLAVPPARADLLLAATRRRQGALWRAFVCALAHHRAMDVTGAPLFQDPGDPTFGSEDIIPSPFYTNEDLADADGRGRVLNQVLAIRPTARLLRRAGYLGIPAWPEDSGATAAALESQFLPPNLADRGVGDVIRDRLDRFADFLQKVAGQRLDWRVPEAVPALTPRETPTAAQLARLRDEWLARLRNEYVLSHRGAPTAILTGEEPLPEKWLSSRIAELGLKELLADP